MSDTLFSMLHKRWPDDTDKLTVELVRDSKGLVLETDTIVPMEDNVCVIASARLDDDAAVRLAVALIQSTEGYTLDQVAEVFQETDWANMDVDRGDMIDMGLALIRAARERR